MVTIKDIAKEANVSAGTVDRVLHDRGGVSSATEQRIRRILKQKNFKINIVASSLAMKKHLSLATLVPKFDNENLFWKSPISGIKKGESEVRPYGVETKIFNFDQFDPKNYMSSFDQLIKTKPDGVVMVPLFEKETKKIIKKLNESKIPYLFFNVNLKGCNNICFIGQKSFEAGGLAAQLISFCTHINDELLIVTTRKNFDNYRAHSQRVKGFVDYFSRNNRNVKIHQIHFDSLNNRKKVVHEINQFLKLNPKIKGIMVPSSRTSNVSELIDDKIIEDLNLVGFDTTPNNVEALKKGKITFLISQKSFNQGYKSIRTMTDFLLHKKIPNDELPSPLEIITKENVMFSEFDRKMSNKET